MRLNKKDNSRPEIITNVSFIVIARNESFAVEKCLSSIASMQRENCEVICVDSDSSDNTLNVMRSFKKQIANLKTIKCTGHLNAAVARNAGLKHASKENIFFIDGDVELYEEFISEALSRISSGKASAVTGKLNEIQYDQGYKREVRRLIRRQDMTTEKKCLTTGGIFLASKDIVDKVGVWNENFDQFEDFNYTLRLSRHGTLIQLPKFIGVHHTQEFHERSWEHYKKGIPILYGTLIRQNLDRPKFVMHLIRCNRGFATSLLFAFVVSCGLILAAISSLPIAFVVTLGISCLAIDCIYSTLIKNQKAKQWILGNYLTPPMIVYGVLSKARLNSRSTRVEVIV